MGSSVRSEGMRMPRFTRTDRFPSSCSLDSALNQLEFMGISKKDIRIVFLDRRRYHGPEIVEQEPAPGTSLKFGQEITLRVQKHRIADIFPEGLFFDQKGQAGRDQLQRAALLFAPFDNARSMVSSRLRLWNFIFSGGVTDRRFEDFIFDILSFGAKDKDYARRFLEPAEFKIWVRTLPALGKISGMPAGVVETLARFFPYQFKLLPGNPVFGDIPFSKRFSLSGIRVSGVAPNENPTVEGGSPILGRAFLGNSTQMYGGSIRLQIGPLKPLEFSHFITPALGAFHRNSDGCLRIELGSICNLESYLDIESLTETPWAKLIFLLRYLLPVSTFLVVELLQKSSEGWYLGSVAKGKNASPSELGRWTRLSGVRVNIPVKAAIDSG